MRTLVLLIFATFIAQMIDGAVPPTKVVQRLYQDKDNGGWIGWLLEDKEQLIKGLPVNVNRGNGNNKPEINYVRLVLK